MDKTEKIQKLVDKLSELTWEIDQFYDEEMSEQFPFFSTSGLEIVREDMEEWIRELKEK
jgi:hypothetical protein